MSLFSLFLSGRRWSAANMFHIFARFSGPFGQKWYFMISSMSIRLFVHSSEWHIHSPLDFVFVFGRSNDNCWDSWWYCIETWLVEVFHTWSDNKLYSFAVFEMKCLDSKKENILKKSSQSYSIFVDFFFFFFLLLLGFAYWILSWRYLWIYVTIEMSSQ